MWVCSSFCRTTLTLCLKQYDSIQRKSQALAWLGDHGELCNVWQTAEGRTCRGPGWVGPQQMFETWWLQQVSFISSILRIWALLSCFWWCLWGAFLFSEAQQGYSASIKNVMIDSRIWPAAAVEEVCSFLYSRKWNILRHLLTMAAVLRDHDKHCPENIWNIYKLCADSATMLMGF